MPTKLKTDPESLRKRALTIMARDIKDIESTKQKGVPLDQKAGALLVQYVKTLTDIMDEEERWARQLLTEASKLSKAELEKRVAARVEAGDDKAEEDDSE